MSGREKDGAKADGCDFGQNMRQEQVMDLGQCDGSLDPDAVLPSF